jgi:transposase
LLQNPLARAMSDTFNTTDPRETAWMTAILDELRLTELVTSITGLSAIGVAAILAETGDPNRFATARALVKHAGLAPRETCPARSSAARS